MFDKLDQTLARYRDLEGQLAEPALNADRPRFTQVAKEHASLTRLVRPYLEYKKLTDDLVTADALAAAETDDEMRLYAEEERDKLRAEQQALVAKLEDLLLDDPSEQFDSIIMEIRAGTGGDEAALFAGDLYNMYARYARVQNWRIEEISFSPGEAGGYKEITLNITGDDVFGKLRYESGGHRVQRVPKTETQGRIHTSAATVAVLPVPDEVQVEIREQDLIWERMRAGGAGGQHVNKTESAVRIWYKKGTPEEMEVKCQDERSQHKNYERAKKILRSRLFERQQQKLHQERADLRRNMIGSGDRSEKIRTYNFPQSRVTDHRINVSLYKLDTILMGEMEELVQSMRDYVKKQRLGEK